MKNRMSSPIFNLFQTCPKIPAPQFPQHLTAIFVTEGRVQFPQAMLSRFAIFC
jgi:hypothetical protein